MQSLDELVQVLIARIDDTDLEYYKNKDGKLRYALRYSLSAVNNRCGFKATDDEPLYSQRYEMNILDGACWYLAKIGAEGYASTSENGVSAAWKDIPDWLLGVSGGVCVC